MPAVSDSDSSRTPTPTVIVQTGSPSWSKWLFRGLCLALGCSILANIGMFASFAQYFAALEPPQEKFHSGDTTAASKIVVLTMSGTIMPPYTERLIKQIEAAQKADAVKGVLLVVDSPGGFVADSHQIYHRLQQLNGKKPVFVQMKRMAASGGYYIAMGAGPKGKIFAEPTTWTGSIGVIIPRYDLSQFAEKWGIGSDPLKTGEFKDALNPLRPLSDGERQVWQGILTQSFDQFVEVIDSNRENLTDADVRKLATGQIYTAKDAKANGLVDEIGYEDDALAALKTQLGLKDARVVSYSSPASLWEIVSGAATAKPTVADPLRTILESSVPRALYLCSWIAPLPQ